MFLYRIVTGKCQFYSLLCGQLRFETNFKFWFSSSSKECLIYLTLYKTGCQRAHKAICVLITQSNSLFSSIAGIRKSFSTTTTGCSSNSVSMAPMELSRCLGHTATRQTDGSQSDLCLTCPFIPVSFHSSAVVSHLGTAPICHAELLQAVLLNLCWGCFVSCESQIQKSFGPFFYDP